LGREFLLPLVGHSGELFSRVGRNRKPKLFKILGLVFIIPKRLNSFPNWLHFFGLPKIPGILGPKLTISRNVLNVYILVSI